MVFFVLFCFFLFIAVDRNSRDRNSARALLSTHIHSLMNLILLCPLIVTYFVRHHRSVCFLLCPFKCPVGCSLVVVSLTCRFHLWTLLRCPMLGSDGIQLVGIPYSQVDSLSCAVCWLALMASGTSMSTILGDSPAQSFRRVLTASDSSVSSVHVQPSCSVHRQGMLRS